MTDPEATCLVALAGLASGKADPGATRCPVADQPYARAGSAPETAEPDGAEATPAAAETFRCPDPKHHLGETGLHAERTGAAWALVQDLPDPTELTATEQPLGSSGLLLTRTVRRDPDAVRFLTRPNLGLRVIVTLLLLGLSLHVGYTVTIENYSGWRPGGTPPMPSRPVFAFQVLVATLLNPLAWGAIALAVGLGPVRTVPLGAERPWPWSR